MTVKLIFAAILGVCLHWAGSVSAQAMRTDINSTLGADFLSDPYCSASTGTCSTTSLCTSARAAVSSMPSDAVDWVLVEVWGLPPNSSGSLEDSCVVRKSALLLSNGRLVDPSRVGDSTTSASCGAISSDTTNCPGIMFTESESTLLGNAEGAGSSLHVVVRHRNHIAVLSNSALTPTADNVYSYDFASTSTNVPAARSFGGTLPRGQAIASAGGVSLNAMFAGDANEDGEVQVSDYAVTITENFGDSGSGAYNSGGDINLDDVVNLEDYSGGGGGNALANTLSNLGVGAVVSDVSP